MRKWFAGVPASLIASLIAGLIVGLSAAPAGAQTPPLDMRVERDLRPSGVSSELSVNLTVTITEPGSGQPPAENFDVFAFAHTTGGEKTITFDCGQVNDNSPEVPRGVYACTVIVDHGGVWTFVAAVNKRRLDDTKPPVQVGRASAEFDIVTNAVAPKAGGGGVKGRFREVALLWGHSVAAAAWFVGVAVLAAVALPGVRRRLSPLGLHWLEERLDLAIKCTVVATALTIGSGTYLLVSQTAYDTPFSPSAVDGVFALPYGRPYFLALGLKLALYALMVAACVPLVREARRRLRSGPTPGVAVAGSARRSTAEDASPWASAPRPGASQAGARTALASPVTEAGVIREPVPEAVRPAPASARLGSMVVVAGGAGIWMCVTLLKYFHELIEAARGLL